MTEWESDGEEAGEVLWVGEEGENVVEGDEEISIVGGAEVLEELVASGGRVDRTEVASAVEGRDEIFLTLAGDELMACERRLREPIERERVVRVLPG